MMLGDGISPYTFWWCSFSTSPSNPSSSPYTSWSMYSWYIPCVFSRSHSEFGTVTHPVSCVLSKSGSRNGYAMKCQQNSCTGRMKRDLLLGIGA